MEIIEARMMIERGILKTENSVWTDLGCGSGVFTYALAGLLSSGNKIMAIDKQSQTLDRQVEGCEIEFLKSDIEHDPFPFASVHGILMANSLHYIKSQSSFIKRLKNCLSLNGKIILVEYDTDKSNQWVPYPISFTKAKKIFVENGFENMEKIGERKSVYRSDKMYACLIS